MKTIFFSIFLISVSIGFSQGTNKPTSWYKCMKGMIGTYPITMHLHRWENNYTGYYYYERSQEPIPLSGIDSMNKKVGLSTDLSGPNEIVEYFTGNWSGNKFEGTWRTGKSAPLKFSLSPSTDSTLPDFIFVYTKGNIKLRPKMNKSPEASFFAASIWPSRENDLSAFLKKQLLDISGGKSSVEIGKLLLDQKKIFFDEYKEDFKDATDKEISEYGQSYNYDLDSKASVAFSSSRLLSIAADSYSYTGGAHGNYGTSFYVIDLRNKKRLSLGDVLNVDDSITLNVLLEQKFRKQYGIKPTEKLSETLFEDYIKANDNFFITGKGIGFNYNPYEIAAYVFGEIRIFIPFREISSLLKPEFLRLIGEDHGPQTADHEKIKKD